VRIKHVLALHEKIPLRPKMLFPLRLIMVSREVLLAAQGLANVQNLVIVVENGFECWARRRQSVA
jgi:hypothetical protein